MVRDAVLFCDFVLFIVQESHIKNSLPIYQPCIGRLVRELKEIRMNSPEGIRVQLSD
jgi:hypothetical protein